MEFKITDDAKQDYFIVETSGVFDIDEHSQMLSELVGHSRWSKGKKVLVDHRETSFDKINMDGIVEVANIVGVIDDTFGASHCAIVVSVESFTKATSFKFETATKAKLNIRVFPDDEYDNAVGWIRNQQSVNS